MTPRKQPLNDAVKRMLVDEVRFTLREAELRHAVARLDFDESGRRLLCVAKPGQRAAVTQALAGLSKVTVADNEEHGSGLVAFGS